MSGEHRWANLIDDAAIPDQAARVVQVINHLVESRQVSRATVIVACAQILAQTITEAPPDLAGAVRDGVLTLVDDYAVHFAVIPS